MTAFYRRIGGRWKKKQAGRLLNDPAGGASGAKSSVRRGGRSAIAGKRATGWF